MTTRPLTDFERELGLDEEVCPHCDSHHKNGVCLNGCTLPGYLYKRLLGIGGWPRKEATDDDA